MRGKTKRKLIREKKEGKEKKMGKEKKKGKKYQRQVETEELLIGNV